MKIRIALPVIAIAALCFIAPARAQSQYSTASGVLVPGAALMIPTSANGTTYGPPTTSVGLPVDFRTLLGTGLITGGVNGSLAIGGPTASGSSLAANPLTIGCRAQNAEASAVTNAQVVNAACDLFGKPIVLPYANPENSVYGVTAAITDTTSTSTIASAGASTRNYVTDCMVTNSHATVGTFVKILDGSTIIDEGYAAAAGGGFARAYPVPRRGTAATAVNCQPVTSGANVICSCGGYKGV